MARDSPQHLPALPRAGWSKGQGSAQRTLRVWGQDLGRENAEAEREGDTGSLSEATNSKSRAGQLETPAGRPVPLLPSRSEHPLPQRCKSTDSDSDSTALWGWEASRLRGQCRGKLKAPAGLRPSHRESPHVSTLPTHTLKAFAQGRLSGSVG